MNERIGLRWTKVARSCLGPFSSCCSTWLASLPSSPPPAFGRHSRDTGGGETCEPNQTSRCDWRRDSAVVQGQMPMHPWVIWLKWRRYEWSYVCYRHNADSATKVICQTTSWQQLMITYAHRHFWQIYWPPECWYGGAYYRSRDFYIVTKI